MKGEAVVIECRICHRSFTLLQFMALVKPDGEGDPDGEYGLIWRQCPCENTLTMLKEKP